MISPKKMTHYIKVNHVTEMPMTKNSEAKEVLKRADFNFTVDLKTLLHKTLVDPKLLQLDIRVRKTQKRQAARNFLLGAPSSSVVKQQMDILEFI